MKKMLLLIATILILLGKYLQILMYTQIIPIANLIVSIFSILSSLTIILLSIKFLNKKWRIISISLSLAGFILIFVWLLYPLPITNFLWSIFLFTSLFLSFYKLSHYEIKKFPAFAYSFSLIYILTESISLWRENIDIPFLLIYLTLTLPIYIVGILRIKEKY